MAHSVKTFFFQGQDDQQEIHVAGHDKVVYRPRLTSYALAL